MIVLGLDPGERRIGVAVSDPRGVIARPLTVIERRSFKEDAARLRALVEARGVERVVVGHPVGMDGKTGTAARSARRYSNRLRAALGVEVALWDERLTTAEAERAMLSAGESRARRREVRDAVAAALMLQNYLDAQARRERE